MMRFAINTALLTGLVVALAVGMGCKKDEPPPQQPQGYQQGQYPQGQYPQGQVPPATATPQPTAAPQGGIPCQTDNDPQCLFGKCVGGRCGACASVADCKAGAACMQTPFGMACGPGGGAAPAPAPAPTAPR
jgi:hypothetical protein